MRSKNGADKLKAVKPNAIVAPNPRMAKNALRCVSLGRKNFLFVGFDIGDERAIAMYGLIGTNEINSRTCLACAVDHITD